MLTVALVAVVTPFVWMVLGSFKARGRAAPVAADLAGRRPPRSTTTRSCSPGWTSAQYFLNSIVVAVVVTAGNLLFCSMLGYALAMLEFKGKRRIFVAGHGAH